MDKRTETELLLYCYGKLLTEKQRRTIELHLSDDLSLSEIAEIVGVSRQAVRDTIVRGEEQLYEYEAKLGFMKRDMELLRLTDELIASEHDAEQKRKLIELRRRIEDNDGV